MFRSGRRAIPVRRRRAVGAIVTVVVMSGAMTVLAVTPAVAAPCDVPVVSVIECENSKPGTPESDWKVSGAGDSSIQGFATSISVNAGSTVSLKIASLSSAYHIDILRMGYYGGDGARKIVANMTPSGGFPQSQPTCQTTAATGLIDCGNWAVSATWAVPATAVSGLYMAHLVRNNGGGDSTIPFIVRNDASHSDLLFQTSDTTWQAYNDYGGNSLYACSVACPPGNPGGYKGAFKVSYNRPFNTGGDSATNWIFNAEYPMIRYLEANGYDVSYTSGLDVETRGQLLTNHKAFVSTGHDEYWSGGQRDNVEAARDAGMNLAFFSGNEVFWKTRWEASADGTNTPGRTLVTYKDTHFNAPTDPVTWTGTWQDPRFTPPADGAQPQNALTGQLFAVNAGTTAIQVPARYAPLRLWRNTAVASLTGSQVATLAPGTLGYEWDVDADNGFRPAGLMRLSSTTLNNAEAFKDYGTDVAVAPRTHNLTLYRAASGALVFGAGTVQWAWGLDDANPSGTAANRTMQQATMNLFADMGAQPATRITGLVAAGVSADASAPTSTITSPVAGSTSADGTTVTVSGTASDVGGGVVAGVEVSTDGGTTWHPATGTTAWTYSWVAHGAPTSLLKSRAVDDSGNLQTPGAGTSVGVTCPCSIWGAGITPAVVDSGDGASIEVGVKFTADTTGAVGGVRFYKATANTGTHVGHLWSAAGALLATATFTGESASGWQQASFPSPVTINANTTYVVSYLAPRGHYSSTDSYFYNSPAPGPEGGGVYDSPPLHAVRTTGNNGTNGVYRYSASGVFPTTSFNAENYWVDPVFTPGVAVAPGQVTDVTAIAANGAAGVSWTAPTGSPTSYVVTPLIGGVAQPATTVTGSPPATSTTVSGLTNGTAYTFTVRAVNATGSGPVSAPSNSVTPSASASALLNGGFESGAVGWTTGGEIAPAISTAQKHGGVNSAQLGPLSGSLPAGDSWVSQTVTVPASSPSLSFWYYTGSPDQLCTTNCIYDWIEAQVRSTGGATLASIVKLNSNSQVWTPVTYNLNAYAGQTVVLWFNVHQDSSNPPDDTYLYLDDVAVASSTPVAPGAPTGVTATAGNGSATVSWTAPANGGSPLASYTVTPFIGGAAQAASTVTGSPPGTSTTVTGLTNGTAYTFTVTATNAIGTGPASAPSAAVTPSAPTAPAAPTGVTVTAGNASATVSWTAPANGGSPLTSYTVTPFIGGAAQAASTVTGSPPGTSTTVTGLTNGTAYTFTVTATNAIGAGLPSAPSNAVTPTVSVSAVANGGFESGSASWTLGGQIAPSISTAQKRTGVNSAQLGALSGSLPAGDSWVSQTVTVPASSPSLSFWYYTGSPDQLCTTNCIYDWIEAQVRSTGGATLSSIVKLNSNSQVWTPVTYNLNAYAGQTVVLWFNVHQDSSNPPDDTYLYLDDVAVISSPPVAPGTPTGVTATAGNASATVGWTAPAGSPTSYVVTPLIGGVAQTATTVTGSPPATSTTVGGLTNGTAYTFTVRAVNATGSSPVSAASNAVTPSASAPAVANGGFESGSAGWTLGGQIAPSISTAQKRTGVNSAQLGALSGSLPAGDSWVSQTVTVPASSPSLSFWYYTGSPDQLCTTNCIYDWIEAQVRSTGGATLASIVKLNSNSQVWTPVTYNLNAYAGQTVVLWFNVHQDSSNPPDDTFMYLDDVAVTGT